MGRTGGFFRGILVWSYDRGTFPYDIICALILAFVFFMPRGCLVAERAQVPADPPAATQSEEP
ncbi:MAG: hypothetical protein FJW35_08085 [Acidobacteria bacterium]|nr:hypothetical protein [Acidobacteriota bacterium]